MDSQILSFIKENGIGFVCDAEDYEGLAKILLNLKEEELIKFGKKSKTVYFEKYNFEKFIKTLTDTLKEVAK